MVEIVPATSATRSDPSGEEADAGVSVEHREDCSAICRWTIPGFSKLKQRTTKCLWSKYFEVGGYDCRLLVYPTGKNFRLCSLDVHTLLRLGLILVHGDLHLPTALLQCLEYSIFESVCCFWHCIYPET